MKKSVANVMDKALEGVIIPDAVYLPPAIVDSKVKVRGDPTGPLNLEGLRDRIQKECDPIGQLIALANGLPVASVIIDKDGATTVKYETANLATRIKILEGMRDKIVPNMSSNYKPKSDYDQEDEWNDLTRRRSAQVLAGQSR